MLGYKFKKTHGKRKMLFPMKFTQLFIKQIFLEHFMLSTALGAKCFQYVF